MADQEDFPGTGRQEPIVLSRSEVVALFCFPKGVIPDGWNRKIGFRWKTPVIKEGEVRKNKNAQWLDHWDCGEFVDVGRDDVIGIAWRRIYIVEEEGSDSGSR